MRASIAFMKRWALRGNFARPARRSLSSTPARTVIALFPWDQLAHDIDASRYSRGPRPSAAMTLAWNCRSREEVDAVLDFAISKGASLLRRCA